MKERNNLCVGKFFQYNKKSPQTKVRRFLIDYIKINKLQVEKTLYSFPLNFDNDG